LDIVATDHIRPIASKAVIIHPSIFASPSTGALRRLTGTQIFCSLDVK
jgi:hypothetical protein